ncbi:hypothetical protein F5X96DRAFT_669224 [Biscogniauxia mediterranea]|nr:hypothetical protein F5X96DRAFT_669224 [Biscogniauxia mediterranea]
MSIHYVESVSSGCGDRVTLSIRWNKAQIEVYLDPSLIGNIIQDSFIEKYNAAVEDGDYEEEEMSRTLPPQRISILSSSRKNIPKAMRTQQGTRNFELKYQLPASQDLFLPKFWTRDIHVLQKLLGDGYIARVSAGGGGREICCKVGDELRADASQRELSCLLTISTSQHAAAALRVPKASSAWSTHAVYHYQRGIHPDHPLPGFALFQTPPPAVRSSIESTLS